MGRLLEEIRKQREERQEGTVRTRGKEAAERIEELGLAGLTRAVPEALLDDVDIERDDRRLELRDEISEEIDESFRVDLGRENVLEAIRDLNDLDLDGLGEEGLLNVIAESSRLQASVLNVMLENQVDMLLELSDIRTAVEPGYNLNVSGVAVTEEPDDPVPIVPELDDREYDVRTLYLRSMPYNTHDIYFGDDGVRPQSGFILRPGEYIVLNFDYRDIEIYMTSEEPGQEVGLMGVF